MSITAVVRNYIKFSGDQENELNFSSGDLEDSPAMQQLVDLSTGDNTVLVPDSAGFTVHGVAIVPPEQNSVEVILKGLSGDTGVNTSSVNVSVVQFGATPPASIVLAVLSGITVRLIWF